MPELTINSNIETIKHAIVVGVISAIALVILPMLTSASQTPEVVLSIAVLAGIVEYARKKGVYTGIKTSLIKK